MRELIKTSAYSFDTGTRQISVTDTRSFSASDIRLIYNETQDVVLVSSGAKMGVTVANGVITYPSSLPVLATGDILTIEIDFGLPDVIALNTEVQAGKVKLASAITTMGQASSSTDTFEQMSLKIKAISTQITVSAVTGNPSNYHSLSNEIANFYDVDNPYAVGILLKEHIKSVHLTGASKYKTSDGVIHTGSPGPYTIEVNSDPTKITNFIIFRFPTPSGALNFTAAFGAVNYSSLLLEVYIKGIDINSQILLNSTSVRSIHINSEDRIPYIINSNRVNLTIPKYFAASTAIRHLTLPQFRPDATDAEKVILIDAYAFQNSFLETLSLPTGLKKLTINPFAFNTTKLATITIPQGCYCTLWTNSLNTAGLSIIFEQGSSLYCVGNSSINAGMASGVVIKQIILKDGMDIINWANYGVGANGDYLYIGLPNTSINITNFNGLGQWGSVEIATNWNLTFNLNNLSAVPTKGISTVKTLIVDKLVDKRKDGVNPATLATDSANKIVIGTNTQFTKVHRVGDTITINGVNKVVESIQSDTQLTITTNGATTGSGYSYGINKTLTLNTTIKSALTTAYPTWTDATTAKGWTIA